uniref:Cation-transporting ATPase n=1 Tax=Diabrotica virgifera virgifera TaxID=50390 RepID=A0A6P7G008_DIAVI
MKNCQVQDKHQAYKPTNPTKETGENNSVQYLNYGEEDQMEIQGFIYSNLKSKLCIIFYILTLGTLRLFFHWYPHLHIKSTHTRSDLKTADKVLVTDIYRKYKSYFVKDIKTIQASSLSSTGKQNEDNILECNTCDGKQKRLYQARIIKCKKLLYVWDDDTNSFVKLAGFDKGITRSKLHSFKGQTEDKQVTKRILYGNNEISVPVQTVMTLILLEALTPFYMFQLFSLIVWLAESYFYYTIAIIIMSFVGISTSVLQTRKNQENLRGTVNYVDRAIVCRGDEIYEEVPTTELVPGDLVIIPPEGCEMQCDAVLLTGTCVVNESMLTGESVPITKTPLPEDNFRFQLNENVNHTLFCGTKIIQTKSKENERVFAVVIRTGYLTTKGELVRSILYPPPADFKFETDSYKFIGILFLIAILGVIYTIVSKSTRQIKAVEILIKALDIFTIAVPPALPAAMTVGKLYALNRLKNKQIFCINSRVINVSGSVDCICFDKTGTLTEDELDMWGIVPVNSNGVKTSLKDVQALPSTSDLFRGMATCHSLSIIHGILGGDPLDIKMFESTGWILYDSIDRTKHHHITVRPNLDVGVDNIPEINIVKQFQFSSHLQRMSVIVRCSDTGHFTAFCKGSPEMIMALSKPSSMPSNLISKVHEYTVQGYRVIALSKKCLDSTREEEVIKLLREDVERDLEFCGLIILENKLKPQTAGIINMLNEANLKVVMITGDNLQTGVHIAKECGMVKPNHNIIEVSAEEPTECSIASISYKIISQAIMMVKYDNHFDIEKNLRKDYVFAVTGKSWANIVKYFPQLVPKIVTKGVIFARMSGMQKQHLVEEFKNLGYYVAMCGDGANDCGALKAAHVGISLSEAESSVASPFTSKIQDISCVPQVIKEGRAALITSFGIFKIMLCYSLIEFSTVMILYNIDGNMTSFQFLFIDICLILNFASFFGMTKAHETLDKVPPANSLMGFIPILSMSFYLILSVFFQLVGYYWIQTYDWFKPFVYNHKDDTFLISYENFAVYHVSVFQYITMCIVFSKGKPYRKPLYTNIPFTLSLILTTVLCVWIALHPTDWVNKIMELIVTPMEGRYAVIIIAVINFLVCMIFEDIIVDYFVSKIIAPRFRNIDKSNKQYLKVAKDLNSDINWPSISDKETVILNDFSRDGILNGVVNNGYIDHENSVITKC